MSSKTTTSKASSPLTDPSEWPLYIGLLPSEQTPPRSLHSQFTYPAWPHHCLLSESHACEVSKYFADPDRAGTIPKWMVCFWLRNFDAEGYIIDSRVTRGKTSNELPISPQEAEALAETYKPRQGRPSKEAAGIKMERDEKKLVFTPFGEDGGNQIEMLDLTAADTRPAIEFGAPTTSLNNAQPKPTFSHDTKREKSALSPRDGHDSTLAAHQAISLQNSESVTPDAALALNPAASSVQRATPVTPAVSPLKRPCPFRILDPRPLTKKQHRHSATPTAQVQADKPLQTSKRQKIRILKHNLSVTEQELAATRQELADVKAQLATSQRKRAKAERHCRQYKSYNAPLMRTSSRLLVWVRDMYRAHREINGGKKDPGVEAYVREIREDVGEHVFGKLKELGSYLRDNVETGVADVKGGAEREGSEEDEDTMDRMARGLERLQKLSER